jgi:hypothetical protein
VPRARQAYQGVDRRMLRAIGAATTIRPPGGGEAIEPESEQQS